MTGKTIAVLPFYNEAPTLGKVISEVLKYVDFLVAVNDGSTDDWQSKIPKDERIFLVHHSENLGKGAALNTGFKKALELNPGYIVTIDADLQHPPEFIPPLLERLNNCDFVVGNRMKDIKGMPFARKLSNTITSFLLSLKTGVKIEDSQCGFRAFKAFVIPIISTKTADFTAESEMLIKAARSKIKICFVDIPTIYGNDNSKMKNIEAIWGFIKVLVK